MADEIDHSKQLKAHQSTYDAFMSIAFKGTIAAAIVTAIVLFLITRGHH